MKTQVEASESQQEPRLETPLRYDGKENTRPYVPIPIEYYDEMQYLSNADFGKLVRILMWYSISGEVLPVKGVLCHYINRVIDRQKRYYLEWEAIRNKRREAGRKGAESRWNRKDPSESPLEAGKEATVSHAEPATLGE